MTERVDQWREGVILKLATETLRSFGECRAVVRGSSMLPSIFPRDILVVRHETARSVRSGDVVLFFREGCFCAHRLVDKTEQGGRIRLVTRGDALRENDPPLVESELLGRVAAVVRGRKQIELDRNPAPSELLLRWTVRHSRSAVKWLLRWHSLRTWLARNSDAAFKEVPTKPLESV